MVRRLIAAGAESPAAVPITVCRRLLDDTLFLRRMPTPSARGTFF